jgi:hypothetical protein
MVKVRLTEVTQGWTMRQLRSCMSKHKLFSFQAVGMRLPSRVAGGENEQPRLRRSWMPPTGKRLSDSRG